MKKYRGIWKRREQPNYELSGQCVKAVEKQDLVSIADDGGDRQ